MENFKFNLAYDSNIILYTLLNDEIILRYLTIAPGNENDDVTVITPQRPMITETKSLNERYSDYYLASPPIIRNWMVVPDINTQQNGLICFYPRVFSLKNSIARGKYVFEVYVPHDWHKLTGSCLHMTKRLVELFKDTDLFGNVGKINGDIIRPIPDVNGFVGYKIYLSQYNFVK